MLRQKKRLSRCDWLARTMDVVSRQGGGDLKIDTLCRELGVTKGSFYAHFRDRADFVAQLVGLWAETFTESVITAMDEQKDRPPRERLLALMRTIHRERLAFYDIAVRFWATSDPAVERGVKEVDRLRFEFVRGIFEDMGFSGAELEVRTRLFVVYQSMDPAMRLPRLELDADEQIRILHAFLTRP